MKNKKDNWYIGIIGGDPLKDFNLVDNAINEEIDKGTIPMLFYTLAEESQKEEITLGKHWSVERGLPIYYMKKRDWLFKKADFIFFILDKNDTETKRAIMKYKMMEGKHGRVILKGG